MTAADRKKSADLKKRMEKLNKEMTKVTNEFGKLHDKAKIKLTDKSGKDKSNLRYIADRRSKRMGDSSKKKSRV